MKKVTLTAVLLAAAIINCKVALEEYLMDRTITLKLYVSLDLAIADYYVSILVYLEAVNRSAILHLIAVCIICNDGVCRVAIRE